jgi:fumarylacetoacetase
LPNYKWVPIGYHGSAASIVASGSSFRRPLGQVRTPDANAPMLAPTAKLDYELELGILISQGNMLGDRIPIDAAESHIAGLALLNDWSARDVQAWEYRPLGPFLAKNFATTLSPWLVTLEALAPYRQAWSRPAGDPEPLPYLDSAANRTQGAINIELEVLLQTATMRRSGVSGVSGDRVSQSNYLYAYWTMAQLVTHHTVNGCRLRTGDLLGTGTLSGPRPDQGGSLMERSGGGKESLVLSNGERRTFLQDGDSVALRASCTREGFRRIGFGDCVGTVLPAIALP